MKSKAQNVVGYLASLPEDRRKAIEAVRKVIRKNLPKGYEEGIQYGMIGYYVPHSLYPDGYHCDPSQPLPFASIASQKNHMAVYLLCVYGMPEQKAWFEDAWKATGKKLDMGKSCVRFKNLDDVALDVLGEAVRRVPVEAFVDHYEATFKKPSKRKTTRKKAARKKAPKQKAAASKKRVAAKKNKKKGAKKKASAPAKRRSP